eukprot:6664376-Pyramimonas_sp.AAC.1
MTAAEAAAAGVPRQLVCGSAMADNVAGEAARMARLPKADRARVAQVEHRAFLVRMRLLRAAMDSMAAEEALMRAQQDCHRGNLGEG